MNSLTFWDSYLTAYPTSADFKQRLRTCEAAFESHKQNISKLIQHLNPSTITILGSGYLNDIPLEDLVQDGRKVHLVDWIDNVSQLGVSRKIIVKTKDDHISCLFCSKSAGELYCRNYTGEILRDGVCTGYAPISTPFDSCKNYAPAVEPQFLKADVTGGMARHFSELVAQTTQTSKTIKQAFTKAIQATKKLKYSQIEIASHSMDFVTSSMVMSQFDAEPYGYFSKLVERKFGYDEVIKREDKLRPLMEQLRTQLFSIQVETHIKEIYRIVKKNGKPSVYLSSEMFRSLSDGKGYFLVQDMTKALEIIGKYFHFEFDDQLQIEPLKKINIGGGISLNHCFVLVPK